MRWVFLIETVRFFQTAQFVQEFSIYCAVVAQLDYFLISKNQKETTKSVFSGANALQGHNNYQNVPIKLTIFQKPCFEKSKYA